MSHPYKAAGHGNDPQWLHELHRATGGGVSEGKFNKAPPEDYNEDTDSVGATKRFLPKYDFDYDPTGGGTTQGMIFGNGEGTETDDFKKRVDNPLRGRKRGGEVC